MYPPIKRMIQQISSPANYLLHPSLVLMSSSSSSILLFCSLCHFLCCFFLSHTHPVYPLSLSPPYYLSLISLVSFTPYNSLLFFLFYLFFLSHSISSLSLSPARPPLFKTVSIYIMGLMNLTFCL